VIKTGNKLKLKIYKANTNHEVLI